MTDKETIIAMYKRLGVSAQFYEDDKDTLLVIQNNTLKMASALPIHTVYKFFKDGAVRSIEVWS